MLYELNVYVLNVAKLLSTFAVVKNQKMLTLLIKLVTVNENTQPSLGYCMLLIYLRHVELYEFVVID